MKYNFDEVIERKNTYSVKYDFAVERGKHDGILPFWVADMDFKSPPEVIAEMVKRCDHGIYGYTDPKEDYYQSVQNWFSKNHSLSVEKEWIVVTGGIVFAINCAIRAFTKEGEGVLVQKPVYYPFFHSILKNKRRVINNPLVYKNGRYEIDFADFEHKIINEKVKLFILCSPHNPVGRVWTKQELEHMGEICKRHQVIVIADEIHSEFAYGKKHMPFWLAGEDFDDISVLCTSPSKAFNQAGLQHANVFIKNQEIKNKLKKEIDISGYGNASTFGLIACKAAYDFGQDWLEQCKDYIQQNIDFTKQFIKKNLPKVRVIETEGTYLMWLDFRELGLSQSELDQIIIEKANLWLDSGTIFGKEGEGFQRINIATPRKNLEVALENLKKAFC